MIIPFGLPDRGFQTNLPVHFWYRAPGGTTDQPADVHVLSLLDHSGDDDSTEFGLFDTEACAGTNTAVIGYSKRRDRVVWYPVLLEGMQARLGRLMAHP
jgi:hypothetical protein